jgi:hypothetical protein
LRELGEGVWRVRRGENTAPEDALRGYIRGLCGRRRFLIFRGVFGIAPLCSLLALGLDYFDLSIVALYALAAQTPLIF